ncbi:MAG: lamin tail domain-containing protein, partial [Patescibacteria group bacterium]
RLIFILFLFFLLSSSAQAVTENSCVCAESISLHLEITALYPNPLSGEFEWVELENTQSEALDLSFYTLEDATAHPWSMSGTLTGHQRMQIQGFPFQLNNGEDSVTLKTVEGVWMDTLSYSSSSAGQIITKQGSGSGAVVSDAEIILSELSTPSEWPEFSEALPNPEGSDSTEEWIELYNPYDHELVLNGLKLDDAEGGSSPYELSGTLAAETYLLFWVEDSGLTLNNTTDSLRLLGTNDELLWEFSYESPVEGESWAVVNGVAAWSNQVTPGADNLPYFTEEETSEDPVYENGDLSEQIEVTEVFPNPEGTDQAGEWIELTNGGNETVNLSNWIIDDGEGGSEPYRIPENTVIAPGETLLIPRSESGIALNNSDETVQVADYTGEIMSEVHYDSSEEGMSYSEIQIEEMTNTQAGLENLGVKISAVWAWVTPTPGENNPAWKQFKGEVTDYDGESFTLFDGYTPWTLKAEGASSDDLFYQKGNILLVHAAMQNGMYHATMTELIESAKMDEKFQPPWGIILMASFSLFYLFFLAFKKYKKNIAI